MHALPADNGHHPPVTRTAPAPVGEPERLHVVVVGHVDHGKSTLIGRLLHDTGSLQEGRIEAVRRACEAEGVPFEYAFLLDALLEEQEQNVTIDTTRIPFRTARREYAIIDAPGHTEFLKNMITGAASASAAFVLLDAREGVREQSRRHAVLLQLLGVEQIVVLVNKMDLVGYSEGRFAQLVSEFGAAVGAHGIVPSQFIPISARGGDNVAVRSAAMPWWRGPTAIDALDAFRDTNSLAVKPLRFVVQDVYREPGRRLIAGRVEAGVVREGERVFFAPGGKETAVRRIVRWSAPERPLAETGESIALELTDELFVERGAIAGPPGQEPFEQERFEARVFWLSAAPLTVGARLTLRLATQEVAVQVEAIRSVLDAARLEKRTGSSVGRHEIADVALRALRPLVFDTAAEVAPTGRFVLYVGRQPSGGGLVLPGSYRRSGAVGQGGIHIARVTPAVRAARHGHPGLIVWLTGLSGSGKSTLAAEAERQLFASGREVCVLDGDKLRQGLCAGLGFSREDRAENVRRAAHVATLLAEVGFIVLVALISPYAEDRALARSVAPCGRFFEVYVRAPLEVCRARDPKGLYARASAGGIPGFTGLADPYEEPEKPDLVLSTDRMDVDSAVRCLLQAIESLLELGSGPEI